MSHQETTQMKQRSRFAVVSVLALLLGLPACGGGDDGLTRAVVTVRAGVGANLSGIRQLRVDVSSSGGNVTLNIPETQRNITLPTTFSVNFPKDRTGLATFNVTALDGNGTALATNSGMVNLIAGESVSLEIFLGGSPPMDGGVDDGGTINDGAPADAPAEAVLTLVPTTQDYGNVVTGNSAIQIFTVMNAGGTSTGAPTAAVGGDTASFVIDTNTCTAALAPGASCMVGVKFQPATAGAKNGDLTVNATPGGTVTATLTGNALPPSALTFTPSSLTFASQLVGTPSAAMMVTVRNTGGATSGPITLSLGGTSAGDFTISAQTCNGMTLAANATCTASIVFQPTSRGSKTANLNLAATPGGPTAASLLGTGQAPALLSIAPTSTTFSDQNTGTTSAARSFTVSNSGDVVSSVPTVSLGGTNANQFAISSNGCTAGVANGSPCTISVTFTPTSAGAKSATLNVVAATGGSTSATLGGNGVVSNVRLTAAIAGSGTGTITGGGINCPGTCFVDVAPGTSVTLTANTDVSSTFSAWSSQCTTVSGNTCQITVNANVTATATFAIRQFSITVTKSGVRGAAAAGTVSGGGLTCNATGCSGTVNYSATPITLSTSATSGFAFMSWGAGDCTGFAGTCQIVPNQNRTIIARFRPTLNFMFPSSTFQQAQYNPITQADTLCNTRAQAAGLSGTYRAWLSTSTTSAITRLTSANATVRGWIRPDGVSFADTLTGTGSLTVAGPFNAPNRDETNADLSGTGIFGVYTGTLANGTVSTGNTCGDWMNTASPVQQGNLTLGGTQWTQYQLVASCGSLTRVYCFGVDYSNQVTNP